MGDSLSVARSCHVTRATVTVLLVYALAESLYLTTMKRNA